MADLSGSGDLLNPYARLSEAQEAKTERATEFPGLIVWGSNETCARVGVAQGPGEMSLLGINLDLVGVNFLPKCFYHEFKRGH
jgi:hypothetical protein